MILFTTSLLLLIPSINPVVSITEKKRDRFEVIWNTPSAICWKSFNVTIPLARYGIKFNRDQAFSGDEMVVFYSTQLGLYPYVTGQNNTRIVNGGIPQRVNIRRHLAKMRLDIRNAMPKKNFSGLAVIDWEEWRPLWTSNYDKKAIYKKLSVEYIMSRYPLIRKKQALRRARKEFDKAARYFMLETIRYAKRFRPLAKWGFYGFPYCHSDLTGDRRCNDLSQQENDRMDWLFRASIVLYPTIYLDTYQESWLQYDRHLYAQEVMKEALRVTKNAKRPYYTFTKFTYDPYAEDMTFYRKLDLCSTIKQTADMGGSGVVVWSSTSSTSSAFKCKQIEEYIKTAFGLASYTVIREALRCSNNQCSQHGTCTMMPIASCSFTSTTHNYKCVCDHGYHGRDCDNFTLYNSAIYSSEVQI